jgi:hypothetical protein
MHLRQYGKGLDTFVVVGNPVDDGMTMPAQIFWGHMKTG